MTALVLAGGPADEMVAHDPGAPNKAFLTIGGKPLVTRALEALRASPRITRIVAVAPAGERAVQALALADEIRPDGATISASLRSGLAGLDPAAPVLIAAADLPILSAAAITEFLDLAESSDADVVYACVERRVHEAQFPDVTHTWASLRDGTYCGGGLVALRPRAYPALELFLERLGAARKNPLQLASIFGWDMLARYAGGRLGIADVERRASELLRAPAAAAICARAEVAVNVDRPSDIALAERLLSASA